MDTITKGRIGYNILEKVLLKNEWDIYIPILENTKIDCIIIKNNYLWRLQIKTMQYKKDTNKYVLPVRKISHNQGEYKIHLYNDQEIDFFIGINVDTEDIYIVPINIIMKYKSSIGEKTLESFKNNFSLLEPYIGNNISGCDDIGETLTDKADGNTEGI